MPTKKKKYNARFPPARIKKIMQMDEEVGKVAAPVPVIISRALELFVESLIHKSSETTQMRNARTLTTSHIKQTILSEKKYEFLKELVRNVSDVQPIEDDQERTKTRELPTGQRTRGRPRKKQPDDATTSANDGQTKRRGRRKKVEPPVEEKPEEKEVENEDSSDTDIADPDDNGDSDFSANDDEETDTDIEDAGYSRVAETEDRVLAVPCFTSSSSIGKPPVCHPVNVGASCSYTVAPFADPSLPYPVTSQVQISGGSSAGPVNLKIAPGNSAPFGVDPPLEQVSREVHPNTGMSCDGISDPVLPALHNSASQNVGEVQPPLPAVARPSLPSSFGTVIPPTTGFATHRMPPVLSSFHAPSAINSNTRPIIPSSPVLYRSQDPMSLSLRLPSALNESNKFV